MFIRLPGAGIVLSLLLAASPHSASWAEEPAVKQAVSAVYVGPSSQWGISNEGRFARFPLTREFARQALLIAARDELGLTTFDAWLGDKLPTGDGALALNLICRDHKQSVMEVMLGASDDAKQIMTEPLSYERTLVYKNFMVHMETLSHTRFVELLRSQGLDGQPNRRSTADVPAEIEKLLDEMTLTSQFRAVQKLHHAMREEGESPALTGALVRGYANLGILADLFHHPMPKVFRARAMLYAQRMRRLDGEPGLVGKWHRAYAWALAGLHNYALEDLDTTKKLVEQAPDKHVVPDWIAIIDAFSRYDLAGLDTEKRLKTAGSLFVCFTCPCSNTAAKTCEQPTSRRKRPRRCPSVTSFTTFWPDKGTFVGKARPRSSPVRRSARRFTGV